MRIGWNDLKRRAPGAALGSATTRCGDGARSFLGGDRTCQLVPSLFGPSTDSRRSNGSRRCPSQGNVLNPGLTRKGKDKKPLLRKEQNSP